MRRRGFLPKLVVFLLCTCVVMGVVVFGYGSSLETSDTNKALPHSSHSNGTKLMNDSKIHFIDYTYI